MRHYDVTSQTMRHKLKRRHHPCDIRALCHKPCDIKYCRSHMISVWIIEVTFIYILISYIIINSNALGRVGRREQSGSIEPKNPQKLRCLSCKSSLIAIKLSTRCPSIYVDRDRTNFCQLGTRFKKKSRFSPLYLCAWDKDFLNPITSLDICIEFTIGESPRVCSKYSH